MLRGFFLGFIKIHILHHASKEAVFGTWLIEELKIHGYGIGPGTLYPILHSLESEGLLSRTERLEKGKIRKYYEITPKGQVALGEAKVKIKELINEVVD